MQTINQAGLDIIKKYEGLGDGDRKKPGLQPYICPAGKETIGYGHVLREGEEWMRPGITVEQAEDLLVKDVEETEKALRALIRVPVNDNQFSALVSLTFNIGPGRLKRSNLLAKLNVEDFQGAAAEFLDFNQAGGKVLKGLTSRRLEEHNLFNTSVPKPLAKSRTILGSGASAASTALLVVTDATKELEPVQAAVQAAGMSVGWLQAVLAGLAILGAGLAIYARICDRMNKGH